MLHTVKQLAKAAKIIENEDWFKELDPETKGMAIEATADWIAPITPTQQALMTIAIDGAKKRDGWNTTRDKEFPYLNGKPDNQDSLRRMSRFFTEEVHPTWSAA